MRDRLDLVQLARAVAALMVVLFHAGGAIAAEKYFGFSIFTQISKFGKYGVEFFFVLSGFIIYYIHRNDLGRVDRLGRYVWRRVARIYPTYWIIFIGLAVVSMIVPSFRDGLPATELIWIKSLLLLPQDPAVVGGTGAPLVIVAWSLQYELIFYAVFALFIVSPRLGAIVVLACIVWWLATWTGITDVRFVIHFMQAPLFVLFTMGVLCAHIFVTREIRRPSAWLVIGIASFGVFVLLSATGLLNEARMGYGERQLMSLGFGAISSVLLLGLVAVERRYSFSVPRVAVYLGDASYVMYLIHYALVSAIMKVFVLISTQIWAAVAALMTILLVVCAASIVMHLFVEKPILAASRRPFFWKVGRFTS